MSKLANGVSSSTPMTHDEEVELLLTKFPEFSCICELCDCGRHLHHHGCAKGQKVMGNHGKATVSLTHNQDVYRLPENVRPRSSKRPPPPGKSETAGLPMNFSTQQREQFIVRPLQQRVLAEIPKENIKIPGGKIESKTSYSQDFHQKALEPARAHMAKDRYVVATSAKFETRTTNLDMFKEWQPQKTKQFAELPSLTGSILFPNPKDALPQSTTTQSYQDCKTGPRPEAAKAAPNNLVIEGSHRMVTTNQDVYKGTEGKKAGILRSVPQTEKMLGKFHGTSQTRADFPHHSSEKVKPILQPKETIDLRFNNRQSFETEQRSLFKGHDARAHPVVASCKRISSPYTRPQVPIEGQTTSHLHFPKQEVTETSSGKAVKPVNQLVTKGQGHGPRFDGRTMNQEFFKHWGPHIRPRVRHGDPHESNQYCPPSTKFEGQSTTQRTFVQKPLEITQSFKPKEESIADRANAGDNPNLYSTVHKDTYKTPKLQKCKARTYLMQKELLNKRLQQEVHTPQVQVAN